MRKTFAGIYFICQLALIVAFFNVNNNENIQILIIGFTMIGALLFLILDELEGYRTGRHKKD